MCDVLLFPLVATNHFEGPGGFQQPFSFAAPSSHSTKAPSEAYTGTGASDDDDDDGPEGCKKSSSQVANNLLVADKSGFHLGGGYCIVGHIFAAIKVKYHTISYYYCSLGSDDSDDGDEDSTLVCTLGLKCADSWCHMCLQSLKLKCIINFLSWGTNESAS